MTDLSIAEYGYLTSFQPKTTTLVNKMAEGWSAHDCGFIHKCWIPVHISRMVWCAKMATSSTSSLVLAETRCVAHATKVAETLGKQNELVGNFASDEFTRVCSG